VTTVNVFAAVPGPGPTPAATMPVTRGLVLPCARPSAIWRCRGSKWKGGRGRGWAAPGTTVAGTAAGLEPSVVPVDGIAEEANSPGSAASVVPDGCVLAVKAAALLVDSAVSASDT